MAFALVAGASTSVALLLGAAMACLQGSIGALNDLADLRADMIAKPGKPLVRGTVTPAAARVVVVLGLVLGLALSAVAGLGALVVALLGVGTGYLYDLRLKGTGLAWVPFALGVPLLPVYAWIGATGALPSAFIVLVPAAIVAGAALALGNQLADLAADRRAGVEFDGRGRSGAGASLIVIAALHAGVALAALVSLAVLGGRGRGHPGGRRRDRDRRTRRRGRGRGVGHAHAARVGTPGLGNGADGRGVDRSTRRDGRARG